MTDEERDEILLEMKALLPKIEEAVDYLFKPPVTGKPSRATTFDLAFEQLKVGKSMFKTTIWMGSGGLAVLALWGWASQYLPGGGA